MTRPMRTPRRVWLAGAMAAILGACTAASPTPEPTDGPPSNAPTASASATRDSSPSAAASPAPAATPEPPLSLAHPIAIDPRTIAVNVAADAPDAPNPQLRVSVTNLSSELIAEIALRWPTGLAATHVLAPFEPTEERTRDGGPPLVQPWTRWVEGPGERGEPAGSTTLGYGPLEAGASLVIPLYVTRNAPGAASFDLQLLAGEALLTLDGGGPAELRVELP